MASAFCPWRPSARGRRPRRFSEDRKTLKSHPEIWPSNAFVGNYLRLKLLEREGVGNMILAETKGYFKYMADRTRPLWENDTISASCCHGFASYAAELPTPDGMLSVGWRKAGGEKKRKASLPPRWRLVE